MPNLEKRTNFCGEVLSSTCADKSSTVSLKVTGYMHFFIECRPTAPSSHKINGSVFSPCAVAIWAQLFQPATNFLVSKSSHSPSVLALSLVSHEYCQKYLNNPVTDVKVLHFLVRSGGGLV